MASEFDKKIERYRQFLPPMYKLGTNKIVTALVEAWAKGDADVTLAIIEAGKQIFVETAEGKYLDLLGANVGVDRPLSVNLSDDNYRKLIPILSYKPKQIKKTMYEILDIFWGPLYSRANITSKASAPYNLGIIQTLSGSLSFQKDSLVVQGTNTLFLTELSVGNFIKLQTHDNTFFVDVSYIVSDTELFLNKPYQGNTDVGNGSFYLAKTLTLSVDGSSEKTIIIPPNNIIDTSNVTAEELAIAINSQTSSSATSETIMASVIENNILDTNYLNIRTNTPGPLGSIRITGGTSNIFSSGVQNFSGNYVFISNLEALDYNLLDNIVVGSDTVDSINTSIIGITSDNPVIGVTRVEVSNNVDAYLLKDNCFIYQIGSIGFHSRENLITDLKQKTVLYEINPKELIVRIPVTVPALRRTLRGAVHGRLGWSGEIIAIDNLNKTVTVNLDGTSIIVDAFKDKTFSTQLNEFNIVSNTAGINNVIFQLENTADLSYLSTIAGENGFCILDSVYKGSFVFGPTLATFTPTKQRCTLNQIISKGSVYPSINVQLGDNIPDQSGYLVFNFGRNNEESRVKYRARANNNTLLLDPAHIFEKSHNIGEMINLIALPLSGTIPRVTGEDLAVYVTGIEEARLVVQDLIQQTKAEGIVIRFIIDAPEYLWHTARSDDI